MGKYYIGLANGAHDGSISIVDGNGNIVFAEDTERYLQNKRAWGCPSDQYGRVKRLFKKYCSDCTELVIANSWREGTAEYFSEFLKKNVGDVFGSSLKESERYHNFSVYSALRNLIAGIYSGTAGIASWAGTGCNSIAVSLREYDHHLAHAAAACYSSPHKDAVCAILDGSGEDNSIDFYEYKDQKIIRIEQDICAAGNYASLGVFYMYLCDICGFDSLEGEEWKVMGLAPYGVVDENLHAMLSSTITVDGLSLHDTDEEKLKQFKAECDRCRVNGDELPVPVENIAATGQQVFTEKTLELLNNLHDLTGAENLVFGGGCALNSSTNGLIVSNTNFENLYVFNAPADNGNSLGAALLAYYQDNPEERPELNVQSPYLGSDMSTGTLDNIVKFGCIPTLKHCPEDICQQAAKLLADGKIIGWVQGRAEFGPRALGNRSILADARSPGIKDEINSRVKFREEFRPLAPSILHEHGEEYFIDYQESPYMDRTLMFKEAVQEKVPGVVHANGSGRLQTVKREWNERYHSLISSYYDLTGVPLVLNTSFNVMGKPIIDSVEDAIAVFYTTGLDALVIEDYLIVKE
ncbi:carbamoyltransferase [Microbulbifer sp. ZKSA006]|uniref:carbamoyltransferase family protein n=1 Tax=Microbulbifer sp. ZKSA006 TaxID=3243390 RepID=UPI00403A2A43